MFLCEDTPKHQKMGLWNPARADEDASRKGGNLAFARNPIQISKMMAGENYFSNKTKF
jgi:hypothetical protein